MNAKHITAKEFYDAFLAEWNCFVENEPSITGLTPYEDRTSWTKRIQDPGGFLNRVMNRLSNTERPLYYRTEWYFVDALYVGGVDLYQNNYSYPSSVNALIEHEFDEDLETEMWKLIHWRSPLKIIINYDWSDAEKTTDARKNYLSNKITKLREMLSIVNHFQPEDTNTEYLLLIARRSEINSPITWRAINI